MQHEMPYLDNKNIPTNKPYSVVPVCDPKTKEVAGCHVHKNQERCVPEKPVDMKSVGRKDDSGKLDWSLVDFSLLEGMVRVLMKGAVKYDRDNWQMVPDPIRRYTNALKRHLFAIDRGEMVDKEDNEHHIDHVLCCALFLKYFYLAKEKE